MAIYYGPSVSEAFECFGQLGIPWHNTLQNGWGVICKGTANGLPVEVTITQEGLTGDAMIKIVVICGVYRDEINFWDDRLIEGSISDAVRSAVKRLKAAIDSNFAEEK